MNDSRIQFFLGERTGQVWLDDVRLTRLPPDVYRRDFTNGAVLLNGGRERPRHEYILDDAGPEFSSASPWRVARYDRGVWEDAGPFYHTWGEGCHQLDGREGAAQMGPGVARRRHLHHRRLVARSAWSRSVVFEVVAGGKVVASTTVDQA